MLRRLRENISILVMLDIRALLISRVLNALLNISIRVAKIRGRCS